MIYVHEDKSKLYLNGKNFIRKNAKCTEFALVRKSLKVMKKVHIW